MKLSLCIPQYNRIEFLLKGLAIIEQQSFPDIEVVISDDCSTDSTEADITAVIPKYKYPLIYHRNATNQGYDRNYRKCIELSTGDYVIILGNDDTINPAYDLQNLVDFLDSNNYPELGFANFIEEANDNFFVERAQVTGMLGSDYQTAMRYYSCFSFVGGLIYRKDSFDRFNSDKHDGSIYAQMYMGCLMVASGSRLFSIHEPMVIKDIVVSKSIRNTYADTLAKNWKQYRVETGGLISVMHVLIDAFRDADKLSQELIYFIFKRIYTVTYPFWIISYKEKGSFAAAWGLVSGLKPHRNHNLRLLNNWNRFKIRTYYLIVSFAALITPVFVFNAIKNRLYKSVKRRS